MADVVTGVHAITLHIRDPTAARAFYRDVLGLQEVAFNEAQRRAVFALPGTTTLLTMHVMAPGEEGREPGTVSGVVFRNPDPRAACAEIVRRGGTVTVPATEFETPKGKFLRAAFADPDGNEFLITNRVD
jgi:catechol 2,3-dioxygenase-like lactoylglutathione lyase family enzyme